MDRQELDGSSTIPSVCVGKLEYASPKLSHFGRFDSLTLAKTPRGDRADGVYTCKEEGPPYGTVACFS